MSISEPAQLPAWDRLAAAASGPLRVEPVRRVELDEAWVDDDDLPELDAATIFWAWPAAGGWWLRAARIRDDLATPYLVLAARLRLVRPDPNLLRLLGGPGHSLPPSVRVEGEPRPMERPSRHLACICRMTAAERVYRAIEDGWRTVDELKRATGVAFGECQGRRCVPGLAARLDLAPDEPRAHLTPRPPLVPVPAAVLAAFAAPDAPR